MPAPIDRDTVRHLASLARIQLSPDEEALLERDLKNILAYFEQLQAVHTDAGRLDVRGEEVESVFREDTERESTNRDNGHDAFPDAQDGFLKIPPVFE
jgi:aspartyl-tRNA(Asn)/glutamyl-tRNA(Gln) amidotransferase subunit C